MIKKLTAAVIFAAMLINTAAFAETADCTKLKNKAVYFSGEMYLPVCEALEMCGFTTAWSKDDFSYKAEKDGRTVSVPVKSDKVYLNGEEIKLEMPTAFRNNVLYMPKSAAEKLCGVEFELSNKNIDFSVGDDFRFSSAESYNGFYICDGSFVFKPYYISQSGAAEYADIIRKIADSLPGVRIFSMLVPEGSEIYAPKNLKCGQTDAFKTVGSMLPETVTAVNVCSGLYRHGGEKIYFNTDHHWTQRGAYYAYGEFLAAAGGNIDPISSFRSCDFYNFKGSYMKEGLGGDYSEIMERFMPKSENIGYIYEGSDPGGAKTQIRIVNPDDNTYACFIGGDNALTELCGTDKSDKVLCIVKESFGNALATWAVNNYKTVYVVDVRKFDGSLRKLHEQTGFDDLLIESYAESVGSRDLREALGRII